MSESGTESVGAMPERAHSGGPSSSMKPSLGKVGILLAVSLVLFAVAERLRFLHISTTRLPVTGDEALAKLKAAAIAEGERPLLFWGTPYQFPLESYLLSGAIEWLPPTALGARVLLAALALASVFGFLLLARLAFPAGRRWPVLLLLLFPSTYVITLQSAYFIPQHTMTMVFFLVLPLGAYMASKAGQFHLLWAAVTGVLAGLALSTHLLSLPIVAATSILIFVGSNLRQSILRIAAFLPAFALGLLPYLAVYGEASEMAGTVHGSHSPIEAVENFFSPVLWSNLTPLLGLDVVLFPEPVRLHWRGYVPALVTPLLFGFWLLLGFATYLSAKRIFLSLKNHRKLKLTLHDLFVGAIWASLLAFCFSTRAEPQQFRYLLPAAWCFPFLFGVVYTASSAHFRAVLGSIAVFLAVLNVAHTREVMDTWKKPGYAAQAADLQSLDRVIAYLDEEQIRICYATFWIAYRITFETSKRITCDQPFNGRFLGWPLPFADEFDLQQRNAVVLSNAHRSRLQAKRFRRMLKWHRVDATTAKFGPYFIFHDFQYQEVSRSRLVDTENLTLSFSGPSSESPTALIDGDRSSIWSSDNPATEGATLKLQLDKPRVLHRVRIFFERGAIDDAPVFRVEAATPDGDWVALREGIEPTADRLAIDRLHTRFHSDDRQDISFSPIEAVAVRLVVEKPREHSLPWRLSEIQLSEDVADI